MTDREPIDTKNLDRYGSAALPWSRPRDLLLDAWRDSGTTFVLGTVRPDGRPHAAGIGALWLDGDLYFTTSPDARKGRNLAANPAATIFARLEGIDVVFEGEAVRVTDAPTLERAAALYSEGGCRPRWRATRSRRRTAHRAPARRRGSSTASRSTPCSGWPAPSPTARRAGASNADSWTGSAWIGSVS
jgi:hypothetical protein